jgi:hypothetical protein
MNPTRDLYTNLLHVQLLKADAFLSKLKLRWWQLARVCLDLCYREHARLRLLTSVVCHFQLDLLASDFSPSPR